MATVVQNVHPVIIVTDVKEILYYRKLFTEEFLSDLKQSSCDRRPGQTETT